jgi:voltage-gated potassium channel Kch
MLGLLVQVYNMARAFVKVVAEPAGRALAVLVLLQLTGGTIFYTQVEGWSWLDALYFSVTTLTTVGLGDLTPATSAGKVFTMLFIFTGVGLLVSFLGLVADKRLRQPAPRHEG